MYESASYYFGSILAREVYNVNNEALESYTKHLEHAEIAYKTGIVAKYDVIRAETALKEQEKRVVEAQNRYKLALAALKTAIGIDQSSDITLTGSFFDANEPMPMQQAVETAYKQNAILAALDNKASALNAGKDYEKSDRKPIVKAVSQVELLTGDIAQTDPDWFIGVQANVKIFDGGISKARIAGKQSERERVELEKKAAEDKISLAIQSAYLDMDSAKSSLESSRKASELAAESLRLASKRFEVGTGTSLEVLDANLSLSAAKIGEYQSMHMMDLAYLKLHRYLNDISKAAQEVQK
jgi:outer membrane protein TolC